MFYINVWLTVNDPKDIDRTRGLLAQCVAGSRAEDGCERYEVYHSESDPRKFLLCEHWRTKEAWEIHRTRDTVQKIYLPLVIPLVTREPHPSILVE